MLVELEPAFFLHTRPYRETSLLIEAFTRQYGRMTLIARGVKNKKTGNALLQPFSPLLVSWWIRGEMGTLRHIELKQQPYWLTGNRLISGLYLNELLNRLLGVHVPYHELFDAYHRMIEKIATVQFAELGVHLRLFEKFLMTQLGYGITLDRDALEGTAIRPDGDYLFDPMQGCVGTKRTDIETYKGSSLLALHHEKFDNAEQLKDAKRLMRIVLAAHLEKNHYIHVCYGLEV